MVSERVYYGMDDGEMGEGIGVAVKGGMRFSLSSWVGVRICRTLNFCLFV